MSRSHWQVASTDMANRRNCPGRWRIHFSVRALLKDRIAQPLKLTSHAPRRWNHCLEARAEPPDLVRQ